MSLQGEPENQPQPENVPIGPGGPVPPPPAPPSSHSSHHTRDQELVTLVTVISNALRQQQGDKSKVHMAKPEEYDGKPTGYKDFKRSLILYVTAASKELPTARDKVLFALSYLKKETAAKWAQNYVEENTMGGTLVVPGDWQDFVELLDKSFDDPHEAEKAQEQLLKFKQGTRTADEFFQIFDMYRRQANYTGPGYDAFLVHTLKKNLNLRIAERVTLSDPPPTDYESWKRKAIIADNALRSWDETANERRQQTTAPFRRINLPPRAQSQPQQQQQTPPQPKQEQPRPQYEARKDASGVTYTGAGQPMDWSINQGRRNRGCFLCGKIGHFARNCPDKQVQIRSVLRAMRGTERRDFAEELNKLPEHEFVDSDDEEEIGGPSTQGFTNNG